jgi:hypothetical protein
MTWCVIMLQAQKESESYKNPKLDPFWITLLIDTNIEKFLFFFWFHFKNLQISRIALQQQYRQYYEVNKKMSSKMSKPKHACKHNMTYSGTFYYTVTNLTCDELEYISFGTWMWIIFEPTDRINNTLHALSLSDCVGLIGERVNSCRVLTT